MTYALSHKRLEGIALPGLAEKFAAAAPQAQPIMVDAAALAAAAIMQRKRGMK